MDRDRRISIPRGLVDKTEDRGDESWYLPDNYCIVISFVRLLVQNDNQYRPVIFCHE